jgi:thiamine-monophosphate kinase
MHEFDFIARLLAPLSGKGALTLKDDAAVLNVPQGRELVITKDAITAGVHFTGDEAPGRIAQKLLRVNLSDLAAMGAKPYGYFLALMLPESADDAWLSSFAAGLKADQKRYGLTLLGGDTTRAKGPLALSLTALGLVPQGKALLRSGAKPGDAIYVSGTVGDGALGLKAKGGYLRARYELPEPRVKLGETLRGIASACIDISDGLVQDLGHICKASGVGAEIHFEQVPLSTPARKLLAKIQQRYETVLAGGDDYELLFTVPSKRERALLKAARAAGTPVTRIGRITKGNQVYVIDEQGKIITLSRLGYTHF